MGRSRFGSRAVRTAGLASAGALLAAMALVTPAFVNVASAAGTSISVSPSMVARGATVTISGVVPAADCGAGDVVTLVADGALFPNGGFGPSAPRDASGAFRVVYRVPSTTPVGTYQVGGRCGGGNLGISASLTVTSAVTAQPNLTG